MHDRHQKAEFARHLAPHRAQPAQQPAVAVLADQADEPIADLDLQRLDQLDDADVDLGRFRGAAAVAAPAGARLLAPDPPRGRSRGARRRTETAGAACPG
jgi:hypothetical protein